MLNQAVWTCSSGMRPLFYIYCPFFGNLFLFTDGKFKNKPKPATSLKTYVSNIDTPQHLYPSEFLIDKMSSNTKKTVLVFALELALKSEGGPSDVHFFTDDIRLQ